MLILHGASASPFVRKALASLRLKGLEFDHVQQMPFTGDEEYRKLNPLGKIPTLQDGDLTIGDSTAICEYLEDAYPGASIYPTDPRDKARGRWLEEMCDTRVAELAAGIFFQRFMRPMMLNQEPDEALVEKNINVHLPPLLDYLEAQVPASGFLYGAEIMVPDIAIASPFFNAGYARFEIDAGRWPQLAAFVNRVREHPVIAELLAAEAKLLGLG
jgi:glutathione S-transferase